VLGRGSFSTIVLTSETGAWSTTPPRRSSPRLKVQAQAHGRRAYGRAPVGRQRLESAVEIQRRIADAEGTGRMLVRVRIGMAAGAHHVSRSLPSSSRAV
jgi:hypothetical protein